MTEVDVLLARWPRGSNEGVNPCALGHMRVEGGEKGDLRPRKKLQQTIHKPVKSVAPFIDVVFIMSQKRSSLQRVANGKRLGGDHWLLS